MFRDAFSTRGSTLDRDTSSRPHHLALPKMPTFPLSSPIREEVVTPFSPPDSLESPESPGSPSRGGMHTKNPFESPDDDLIERESENTETNNNTNVMVKRKNRRESNNHLNVMNIKLNGKDSSATNAPPKKVRPGLNLVTNFSRTTGAVEHQRPPQEIKGDRTFVGLNDLKSLCNVKPMDRNRLLPILKGPTAKGYEDLDSQQGASRTGRVEKRSSMRKLTRHGLQKSLRKTPDLSPSDRPIVIGISVPRGSSAASSSNGINVELTVSPQKYDNDQFQNGQQAPGTPNIIITPAADEHLWEESRWEESPARPRRPASSIYSQPTPHLRNNRTESIPPVPAIPLPESYANNNNYGSEDVILDQTPISARKRRTYSTGTMFEEDFSPSRLYARGRSFSDLSRKSFSNRLSLDTIATTRRSQGWWNYLLSPLLSRSSTMTTITRLESTPEDEKPPMPSLPFIPNSRPTLDVGNVLNEKQWGPEVSVFSPITPESANNEKRIASHVTEWPDVDEWNAERERNNMKIRNDNVSSPKLQEASPASAVSSQSIPFVMSHSTGETNGTNHFQIQETSQDRLGFRPSSHLFNTNYQPQTRDIPRSIPNTSVTDSPPGPSTNHNPNNPFFQRFVDTLRVDSRMSRPRSDSGSTMIEDDEPDFSPNVREARATPLFRAGGVTPTIIGASTATTPQPSPPIDSSTRHGRESLSECRGVANARLPAEERESTPHLPDYSPPRLNNPIPRYRAILPPDSQQSPLSPGPISPGVQSSMVNRGSIPMASVAALRRPETVYSVAGNNELPPHHDLAPGAVSAGSPSETRRADIEIRRQRLEREDKVGQKVGGLWRGRGCLSKKGCFGRKGPEERKRRRCCWFMVILILLIIIILSVVLAMVLTRKKDGDAPPPAHTSVHISVHTPGHTPDNTPDNTSVPTPPEEESRWLNLTGYPPMPTGISTIAGPNPASAKSGCVEPPTMWSCALPKEKQSSNKPFDPDQPSFKVDIKFKNGTYPREVTVENKKRTLPTTWGSMQKIVRRYLFQKRDDFKPVPEPPSLEDQSFLGNTTDKAQAPFEGEQTPFFVTFLSTAKEESSDTSPSEIQRRDDNNDDDDDDDGDDPDKSNAFPNLTSLIPPPPLDSDGTAAPALLYPLPISQPIRLFDRGLATEHYGFYTYFDRSIFLKSDQPLGSSDTSEVTDDHDGGSIKSAARTRCTWAQTRFLVQIWTQPSEANIQLIPRQESSSATSTSTSTPTSSSSSSSSDTSSSATDFVRPGSLPYPISITLDRHGGDPEKKLVYCYGMDTRNQIVEDEKKLQLEDRGFGGVLIQPAPGIFNLTSEPDDGKKVKRQETDGGGGGDVEIEGEGVDGGTGGCRCEWRNWRSGG